MIAALIILNFVLWSGNDAQARRLLSPQERACIASVQELSTRIRNEPFMEKKLRLLADAFPGRTAHSCQISQLIALFDYTGERLKALGLLAPHWVKGEESDSVLNQFPLEEDRAKAKRLMEM